MVVGVVKNTPTLESVTETKSLEVIPSRAKVRPEVQLQDRVREEQITFQHGDVSWLPTLALQVGWPIKTHKTLAKIILRESGGCPNRRGGDKVDKNCNITGVSEWNHRSDTGLLQINGVNYDRSRNKWAPVCREMKICSKEDQWQLLDAKTNLTAGLILYKLVGWGPWDPCQWGTEFTKRCKQQGSLE